MLHIDITFSGEIIIDLNEQGMCYHQQIKLHGIAVIQIADTMELLL